jgi:outer membrane murein-binding lipoprotein Lpp
MKRMAWIGAWLVAMAVLSAPAWADGPPAPARGEQLERQVRELNAQVSNLEREAAALRQGDHPPADRLAALEKQIADLRAKRAVLLKQLEGVEGRRPEGPRPDAPRPDAPRLERPRPDGPRSDAPAPEVRERLARVREQVAELNAAMQKQEAAFREAVQAGGENSEKAQAARKALAELRAKRDALIREVRGPEGRGPGEGELRRPEGPREGEVRRPDLPREGELRRPQGPAPEPEIDRLRERDPEGAEMMRRAAELERATLDLAAQVRRAQGPAREELQRRLRDQLAAVFDLKLKVRQREAERLQDELKRLNDRLNERRENKQRIVDQRLQQLLNESAQWDW